MTGREEPRRQGERGEQPTGPGGLTVADWNAVGLPVAGPAEADWSADIYTPTITSLSRGSK